MQTNPVSLLRGAGQVPLDVWWLPRPPVSRYPGGFPRNFEARLSALLGDPPSVLQPFGGRASLGTRVDINPDLKPDVVADAHDLPFEDGSFELVLCDPPYSDQEAQDLYGAGPLHRTRWMAEAVRVSSRYVVTYHVRLLPRPAGTRLVRIIVVLLRVGHTARIVQVFAKDLPSQGSQLALEVAA
jgi:hypothetical protein